MKFVNGIMRGFCITMCLLLGFAGPLYGQHHGNHAKSEAEGINETFVVEGFRIGDDVPPGSAVGRAGLRYEDGGYVHIVYGKPYQRGRYLFGGLVGYGQIWAAGAHRATELFTTVPLQFGDHHLEAGAYSLFLTPNENQWTFHVNRVMGMHLADEYDPEQDVFTLPVASSKIEEVVDGLIWEFDKAGKALRLSWGNTVVSIPMQRPAE